MKPRKLLLPMIMLLLQASASADGGPAAVVSSQVMAAVSDWGYVAFLPLVIAAFVIHGWLIRPKE